MTTRSVFLFDGIILKRHLMSNCYSRAHAHDLYQVGVIVGGHGRAFYRGEYQTLADTLIVFDAGEAHAGYMKSGTGWFQRIFLDIEPYALQCIGSAVADKPVPAPHFPSLSAPDLRQTFTGLFETLRAASRLEAEAKITDALTLLVERHADVSLRSRPLGQEPRAVRDVKDYLAAHVGEAVSLRDLGALTGMNWDYLRKVFRKHVGEPPHRYQLLLRLAHAKTLIASGVPIAETALRVGFADQAHLTRAFRKHLGAPPKVLSTPA